MGTYSDPALILPGAVDTTELAAGAVTNDKVDAAAAIALSKLVSGGLAKVTTGSVAGANRTNYAVAHGLGGVPDFVIGCHLEAASGRQMIQLDSTKMSAVSHAAAAIVVSTAWDATNFYITDPVDATGYTFAWMAGKWLS
jgi:hypothetical protein